MFDLTVMGNSAVDVLSHVEESLLTKYDLNKNDFNPVSAEIFAEIASQCSFDGMESGGSTANTAWTVGMMGKHVEFIGHIGDDPAGKHFFKDMQTASINMPKPNPASRTMEVFVLITPDGERTFVSQGVTAPITPEMVNEDVIKKSNWLLLEGYMLTDQMDAITKAVKLALKHDTKIALTVSAAFAIQIAFKDIIDNLLPYVDLLIANDEEFNVLMDCIGKIEDDKKQEELIHILTKLPKIITHSEEGASFIKEENTDHMPTTPVERVLDATGAGDAFVAGFLYGHLENDVQKGLTLGHKLGGKIIQQIGGRINDTDFIKNAVNV